jgi:hypothetical protein
MNMKVGACMRERYMQLVIVIAIVVVIGGGGGCGGGGLRPYG